MPLWTRNQQGELVMALTDHDLSLSARVINEARELWKRDYEDVGSSTNGSGIAVNFFSASSRTAVPKIIIPSPCKTSGEDCVAGPLRILNQYGISAYFESGMKD